MPTDARPVGGGDASTAPPPLPLPSSPPTRADVHVRYGSITNNVKDVMDVIESQPDAEWVATPKIHGANLTYVLQAGHRLLIARRGGFVAEAEHFHGAHAIGAALKPAFDALQAMHPDAVLRVYGEIYGGLYDHPDVTVPEGTVPVQKIPRVSYSPVTRFQCFDVKVNDEYLDFDAAREACAEAGIPFVPVHKRGAWEEVYAWAVDHRGDDIRVEETHGGPLPPPTTDNVGEGYVVRPAAKALDSRGRLSSARLKVKSAKFTEKAPRAPGDVRRRGDRFSGVDAEFQRYVTAARVGSVLSKEGDSGRVMSNVRGLADKVLQDAAEDFAKDAARERAEAAEAAADDAEAPAEAAANAEADAAPPSARAATAGAAGAGAEAVGGATGASGTSASPGKAAKAVVVPDYMPAGMSGAAVKAATTTACQLVAAALRDDEDVVRRSLLAKGAKPKR